MHEASKYEAKYIADFKTSYEVEPFSSCFPTFSSTHIAYQIYTSYCKINNEKTLSEYLRNIDNYLLRNANSALNTTKPFSGSSEFFLGGNGVRYKQIILKTFTRNAKSEFAEIQPLINFMTLDCSGPNLTQSLSRIPKIKFLALKAELLSKVYECHLINNNVDITFINKYLKYLPKKHNNEFIETQKLHDYILENTSQLIPLPKNLESKILQLYLKNKNSKALQQYEKMLYYDNLSQFYLLSKQYEKTNEIISLALENDQNYFDIKSIKIRKSILLHRLCKSLLHLQDYKSSKLLLEKIISSNVYYKNTLQYYYPDMAIVELLLEKKQIADALYYLDYLVKASLVEKDLYLKWIVEIKKGKIPTMRLDLFRSRNINFMNNKFLKSEESQIKNN